MQPEDIMFSQTHEWVKYAGEIATIGITDFAVEQLSDLVFIDLPKVGQVVKQNEPLGEIESVKTVSDINAPVSGEIVEVNELLSANLDIVTQEPFGAGWMVKVKMSNPGELANLLSRTDYEKLAESGGSEPA